MTTQNAASPSPMTIYISSEEIDWWTSSSRASVNLNQSMSPADGHVLAYALKSLGMNGSAHNISEIQQNNKLTVYVEYDVSNVLYYLKRVPNTAANESPDPADEQVKIGNQWLLQAKDDAKGVHYWGKKENWPEKPIHITSPDENTLVLRYDIIIPDGMYSLSTLFSFLSGQDSNSFRIFLAEHVDLFDPRRLDNHQNIQYANLNFGSPQSWGYSITLELPGLDSYVMEYYQTKYQEQLAKDLLSGGTPPTSFQRSQCFPQLRSVTLSPHHQSRLLYDLLFTNYNSDDSRVMVSSLSMERRNGMNPPRNIRFLVEEHLPDQLEVFVQEGGNEHYFDVYDRKYPTNHTHVNRSFFPVYSRPLLDPLYVEVDINLPNHSFDGRSQRNTLARMFMLGDYDKSATSYFRTWENPKITKLDGIGGFTTITIEFVSESNKWEFFNLEFNLEIEFYNIPIVEEEEEDNEEARLIAEMPEQDPIAANVQTTQEHITNTFANTTHKRKRAHYLHSRQSGSIVKHPHHRAYR